MEKFKPFIIPVALLVLIDQMVKIVISYTVIHPYYSNFKPPFPAARF